MKRSLAGFVLLFFFGGLSLIAQVFAGNNTNNPILEDKKNYYILPALIAHGERDEATAVKFCRAGLKHFVDDLTLRIILAESLSGLEKYKDAEQEFNAVINSKDWNDLSLRLKRETLESYHNQLLIQKRAKEASAISKKLQALEEPK